MFTLGIILIVVSFFLSSPFDDEQGSPWVWIPLVAGVALSLTAIVLWLMGGS